MKLLTDDVLLGSGVDVSAIGLLDEEVKGDRILSYGLDTRSASQLGASSSFISTFDGLSGQVGTIDPSAKFTQIASTFSFSDIAVAKDGTIFGITPTQLFKIDPVSGLTSFVGGLPAGVNINALEFANDILYGAGDSNLYAINTTNAGVSLIANLESTGFNSSGDLAFDAPNTRFLATSKGATSDSLYAVSLTGEAAKIGDIGFSNILGLMFEGEKLFGFTADGSRIAINPGTGVGVFDTLVKGISDRIGGASGIQIKKGEVLSSTPGTILSADTIDVFLPPGSEITLEITVTVPGDGSEPIRSVRSIENGDRSASATTNQLPLDVFLLQDLSGSFDDDLPVLKRLVPNFLDELRKIQPDTKFGVGSFIDKPVRPFGDPNNAYVYQLEQPLTNDKEVVRSTVNNLTTSTGGDLSEGQLEALLQVARRTIQTNPIGFRDNARRVVVVSTDDTYHKAGDGVDAKPRPITKPNNGDSVVDPDEDYPSIAQAKQALSDANIFPVFTIAKNNVGSNNRPFYQDLVDNKLGFGKVVELESDSSNLVQAITDGLVQANSQVPLNKSSDDFGYVKDISPNKYENAKPGDKLTFKVKLQNDGTGRDDNLSLRIPGLFGAAAETKVNIKTLNFNQKIPDADTSKKSQEVRFVTNKNLLNIPIIPVSYPVIMRVFEDKDNDNNPDFEPTTPLTNKETYVLVHGHQDTLNKGKMAALAKTISDQNKQVIVLDWSVSADNPTPNMSAGWIHDVANVAVDILKNQWKIDSKNLNLIGHSLGSYVASEIGFILSNKEPDKELNPQYRQNPNIDQGQWVNSLTALDPAALFGGNSPASGLYDLDADTTGDQNPIKFSFVSKFSRAFWGDTFSGDGTGSSDYAKSANESIYVDVKKPNTAFKDLTNPTDSHGDIVYLFRNLLKESGEIAKLLKLGEGKHSEWRENTFGGDEAILVANRSNNEGNDPNISPSLLFLKDKNTQNDDIAYGSTGNDNIDGGLFERNSIIVIPSPTGFSIQETDDATFNDAGNDKLYGDSGNDSIFSGSGNDTLYGGSGNDFIRGEEDNDLIFGGDDKDTILGDKGDDTVEGGKGNDSLEGNDGKDTLIGGDNDDTLWGGGDDSPDSLVGGGGNDHIRGERGDDTLDGGKNNDSLEGNDGKDTLIGGDNDDTLWGGGDSSADSLEGGDGNDSLLGEGGDDILIGGKGKDTLIGGDGSDIFVFSPGDGATSINEADIITDFGFGNLFGGGGVDRISLFGKLWDENNNIKFLPISEPLNTPIGSFGNRPVATAMVLGDEYLAKFNRTFSDGEIQKIKDGFFQRS
ncbi:MULTISPECIES: VWA domain-containing protein [unclassified Microcoleus]|uniref:VWA domain-containing protein n=1 Tax=unclassified Microcoleus TaxID=2642155 RepID=UPI001DFB5AC1|nr:MULTISPECIES: VWA domain-containing protein [unclassified Microcoleus]MCC3454634.1 VWA domain-containing protein [Microcoleus sp. PH2017_08_TRC_O_A]MCC3565744.1 VWA domain-containing protein [Microcoleus sp. PH2017_31_RDM_U_A]MCC3578105.1 VWA domain-containing protein [Microcoleus sp. PH2017_32_RDM_D_A]MCC3616118.1 VWA domain-containing protein [Microcoleus sp. PH2017_38_RDM_U_B]